MHSIICEIHIEAHHIYRGLSYRRTWCLKAQSLFHNDQVEPTPNAQNTSESYWLIIFNRRGRWTLWNWRDIGLFSPPWQTTQNKEAAKIPSSDEEPKVPDYLLSKWSDASSIESHTTQYTTWTSDGSESIKSWNKFIRKSHLSLNWRFASA